MNDRYLFRAKRTDNGEWVKGLLAIMWGQFHIINPNDENTAYPIDPYTICQCTGLTDKNGQKIWENDILKANLDESYPEDITYIKILWNECGFCVNENYSTDIWTLEKWDAEHFQVCGNIFDNPDLLEVK